MLGKLFNKSLCASRSFSHKRLDAENVGFLPQSTNKENLPNEEYLSSLPFVHLKMASMYILYRVCSSQSMDIIGAGFKNLKALDAMLQRTFPALPFADPPLQTLPYITRQTVAYALSLPRHVVCLLRLQRPHDQGPCRSIVREVVGSLV